MMNHHLMMINSDFITIHWRTFRTSQRLRSFLGDLRHGQRLLPGGHDGAVGPGGGAFPGGPLEAGGGWEGKIMGKPWENDRKTMGKPWEM